MVQSFWTESKNFEISSKQIDLIYFTVQKLRRAAIFLLRSAAGWYKLVRPKVVSRCSYVRLFQNHWKWKSKINLLSCHDKINRYQVRGCWLLNSIMCLFISFYSHNINWIFKQNHMASAWYIHTVCKIMIFSVQIQFKKLANQGSKDQNYEEFFWKIYGWIQLTQAKI